MANNKVSSLMPKVKWSEISTALTKNGRIRLGDWAGKYGVSVPTMRKMVELKYGTTITFRRGRMGGVFTKPGFSAGEGNSDTKVAAVNYVPDSPATVDAATEAIVDNILGVGA